MKENAQSSVWNPLRLPIIARSRQKIVRAKHLDHLRVCFRTRGPSPRPLRPSSISGEINEDGVSCFDFWFGGERFDVLKDILAIRIFLSKVLNSIFWNVNRCP